MAGAFLPTLDADVLAGTSGLVASRTLELRAYLMQVMEARNCPLHLNSLVSALLLGWDPACAGYPAQTVDPTCLPDIRHGGQGPDVPVGALARQRTDTGAGELVFEVLARHGRVALCDPWDLSAADPDIAGALAAARATPQRQAVQLIVDLDAVPALTRERVTVARRDRLRRRGRWLSRLGHLHYDAEVGPPGDLDERERFARWLVEHHRAQLPAWLLPPGASAEDSTALRDAVTRCLALVEELLSVSPTVVRCGDTFWTLTALQRSLDDPAELLGRSRIESLGRLVARTYGQPVRLTALGWEIERMAAEYDLDADERDEMLVGTAYARAVFTATYLLVADLAAAHTDGVLRRDGQTKHVRLDDATQWGGLWRAEQVEPAALPWYASHPVDEALNLGLTLPAEAERTDDEPHRHLRYPVPGSAGTATDGRIASSPLTDRDVTWTSTLHRDDLIAGTIGLPAHAAAALPTGTSTVSLVHESGRPGLTQTHVSTWVVPTQRGDRVLGGIGWPARLQVGTILHGQITHGITEITLHTRRLAEPADGVEHEHDPVVRDAALHEHPTLRQ